MFKYIDLSYIILVLVLLILQCLLSNQRVLLIPIHVVIKVVVVVAVIWAVNMSLKYPCNMGLIRVQDILHYTVYQ